MGSGASSEGNSEITFETIIQNLLANIVPEKSIPIIEQDGIMEIGWSMLKPSSKILTSEENKHLTNALYFLADHINGLLIPEEKVNLPHISYRPHNWINGGRIKEDFKLAFMGLINAHKELLPDALLAYEDNFLDHIDPRPDSIEDYHSQRLVISLHNDLSLKNTLENNAAQEALTRDLELIKEKTYPLKISQEEMCQ